MNRGVWGGGGLGVFQSFGNNEKSRRKKIEMGCTQIGKKGLYGIATMSWKEARLAADTWLSTLTLPKNHKGEYLNFREHVKTLKYTGRFREMVLRAARRRLVVRGAAGWNISEQD